MTSCASWRDEKCLGKPILITVFPRQGHYAFDPRNIVTYPAADRTVERIGDLVDCDLPALLGMAAGRAE
jgi:hypothetical protein